MRRGILEGFERGFSDGRFFDNRVVDFLAYFLFLGVEDGLGYVGLGFGMGLGWMGYGGLGLDWIGLNWTVKGFILSGDRWGSPTSV